MMAPLPPHAGPLASPPTPVRPRDARPQFRDHLSPDWRIAECVEVEAHQVLTGRHVGGVELLDGGGGGAGVRCARSRQPAGGGQVGPAGAVRGGHGVPWLGSDGVGCIM
ncbi:MAG: hypothetical protein ACLP1X_17355 [Polyangiaceae bacterium]